MKLKLILFLILIIFAANVKSQTYNFSSLTQLFNDSSALYQGNLFVKIYRNNDSIYQYQSGAINCNNRRLGIASATKWISAAVFLKLAEKNYFSLDDSIGTFLPVFTQNGKGHITLRHSYSMSSGVFNAGNNNQYHTDKNLTLAQSVDSIAILVPILYPTGTMIGYDGSMMHCWGRVAEIVDSIKGFKRDWRTIARQELFNLLDMDSTDYTDFLPNPAVAGGIETTPCDYLKFLKMVANNGIYNGDTILSQSSINEMFSNQTNSAPIYHTYWPSNHPDFPPGVDTMKYTFGAWWIELNTLNGEIEAVTSPGVFGNYPFIDRSRNIYGIFFTYVPVIYGSGLLSINTYLRFLKTIRDTVDNNSVFAGKYFTEIPEKYSLGQNYPNPFNPITSIKFNVARMDSDLRRNDRVTLKVFDLLGKEVKTLVNEVLQPGTYSVRFDAGDLPSGVYFYRLTAGDFSETKKLILLK